MRVLVLLLLVALALPAAARAETIELVTGDKLEGVTILEQNAERWIVEHPLLGRVEIPVDQIKPPNKRSRGLFGTSLLAGWSRSISAGFSGSSGVHAAPHEVRVEERGFLGSEEDETDRALGLAPDHEPRDLERAGYPRRVIVRARSQVVRVVVGAYYDDLVRAR